MTAPQAQLVDIVRQSQEAINEVVHAWAENAKAVVSSASAAQPKLPNAVAMVDGVFDFTEQLIATQREFARTVLSAGAHATEVASTQARHATESVVTQVVEQAEAATERARTAGETAVKRTAAKN